jgi:hypothetical protein
VFKSLGDSDLTRSIAKPVSRQKRESARLAQEKQMAAPDTGAAIIITQRV